MSRLRHTSVLNSQIAASLRTQLEGDQRRSNQQASLLMDVATQLQREWSAAGEGDSSGSQPRATTAHFAGLLEDLCEYASAWAGALTLENEPVHLGTLIRQTVAVACASRGLSAGRVAIQIPQHVPERVRADVHCLSKILLEFLLTAIDHCDGAGLSVKVYREGCDGSLAGFTGEGIVVAVSGTKPAGEPSVISSPDAASALRSALVERLREHMGASLQREAENPECTIWYLRLPLEAALDPVRAGELERASATELPMPQVGNELHAEKPDAAAVEDSTNGAVDFLYLDRQLGSLAQLVLARTAPVFLKLSDDRLTALVVAHEMEDLERIRDLAQAWKASAMSVGGRQFAELLGAVEKQAAAGHVPGEGAMRPLWDALKRLEGALRQVCATAASSQ